MGAPLVHSSTSLDAMGWDPGSARFSGLGGTTPSAMAGGQQFLPNLSSPGWESGSLVKTSRVITIMDRQLLVSDDGEPVSLYALCRKWVQNDPELESQEILPEPAAHPMPSLPPADVTPAAPPPVFPDELENYDAEESLRRLKDHWVSVRQHHQAQARSTTERHRHRLAHLLHATGVAVQQQQQQQQQQQLLQKQQQQQQQQQQHHHQFSHHLTHQQQQQQQLPVSTVGGPGAAATGSDRQEMVQPRTGHEGLYNQQ